MKLFFSPIVAPFQQRWVFLMACAAVFAVPAVAFQSYFPLIQPDSEGYILFYPTHTSFYPLFLQFLIWLGLDLVQITYVQLALFVLALPILFSALLRAGVPRLLVVAFALALGSGTYFSTFYRTIMTESLFCTVMVVGLAFWIDYLRTGKAVALAWTSLLIGIAIGIRPAGVTLAPMLFVGAWLKWRERNVSHFLLTLALVVPLASTQLAERTLYHWRHGSVSTSLARFLLIGKGSMVIREETTFRGPHAATLTPLGKQLYQAYVPVHQFLAGMPLGAIPAMTALYESVGQFQMLQKEVLQASERLSVSVDVLFSELGLQAIGSNIPGYLSLSLIHYVGQWSVASLTFPPTARAVNDYVASQKVPFESLLSDITLHPPAKLSSYIVYPAFLAAGLGTLVLSIGLIPFMIKRPRAGGGRRQYLLIAMFLATSCQVYTIFLGLVNVSTPRFILAYYPQLLLIVIFMALALWPRIGMQGEPH